jgi:hypothetical protein
VPIGWAVDSELSLRFPVIFPYLYATATAQDYFISGDSGAGYLNPTQLIPPRAVSGIAASGAPLWERWNSRYYAQFNLSFTGFVINGAAGAMTAAAEAMYAVFSGAGIVLSADKDRKNPHSNTGCLTDQGVPVMHHVSDLPPGTSVGAAAGIVAQLAVHQAAHPAVPEFGVFRTILQPAQYHADVAAAADKLAANVVWVDPVTMGQLVKIAHAGAGWG